MHLPFKNYPTSSEMLQNHTLTYLQTLSQTLYKHDSTVVRAVHRNRKGVSSIPICEIIVDSKFLNFDIFDHRNTYSCACSQVLHLFKVAPYSF